MEALTAVSIACLTIYDMLKAADKAMTVSGIRLLEKTGGRSGSFRAERRERALSHGTAVRCRGLDRILDALARRRQSSIAVEAAHGRVLADGLVARLTQPPFDASAMDGYAVKAPISRELPTTLEVDRRGRGGPSLRRHAWRRDKR